MKCTECKKWEVYPEGSIHKELVEKLKTYEEYGYYFDEEACEQLCNNCLREKIKFAEADKRHYLHMKFREEHPDFAKKEDQQNAILNKLSGSIGHYL